MEPANELAAALAKAQAEMVNPAFDSTNPHFKSKFASLAAVRNAVIPVLAKHGIACVQDIHTDIAGTVSCTTTLIHASGQRATFGPLTLPVTKVDAQGFGSAATYARRYSLMAIAGVVGDDDDDGNAAVKANNGTAEKANGARITEEQAARLGELMKEVSADTGRFLKYLKVASIADVRVSDYQGAVEALERKRQP
jgi:hypothetical protein